MIVKAYHLFRLAVNWVYLEAAPADACPVDAHRRRLPATPAQQAQQARSKRAALGDTGP